MGLEKASVDTFTNFYHSFIQTIFSSSYLSSFCPETLYYNSEYACPTIISGIFLTEYLSEWISSFLPISRPRCQQRDRPSLSRKMQTCNIFKVTWKARKSEKTISLPINQSLVSRASLIVQQLNWPTVLSTRVMFELFRSGILPEPVRWLLSVWGYWPSRQMGTNKKGEMLRKLTMRHWNNLQDSPVNTNCRQSC